MADQAAIAQNAVEVSISPSQLNAILKSHRELHEVVIKLTEIIQDPSRSASYQSFPRQDNRDVDLQDEIPKPDDSKASLSYPGPFSTSDGHRYGLTERYQKINESKPGRSILKSSNTCPVPDHTSFQVRDVAPGRNFELGSSRARKEYDRKKEQSQALYARVVSSYLAAEYDFQYKLYPDQMYSDPYSLSQAAGLDPWGWTQKAPEPSDGDAYNAYHQLSHGQKLHQSVRARRSELMEALFPLRTSHILQSMSWPELEYSYSLHLKEIVNRCGLAKRDNAIGFVDSDVTSIILEVGRFFTELDYSNRPKDFQRGIHPEAVGPFVSENWSKETREKFTLDELHRRCHNNKLIKDWEGNKVLRVLFDPRQGKRGTGATDRQAEILYILETIFSINKARRRGWPLRRPLHQSEAEEFILDFLRRFDVPDSEDSLEQTRDQVFAPRDLNMKTLKRLGGLKVVWTDCIKDHLRLSIASRTITLFWDISLLDQSLLFWYNAPSLNNMGDKLDSSPSHQESESTSHVLYELRSTYRLLFHNMEADQFTTTETCAVRKHSRNLGIRIHDLRVDPNSPRARRILKHLLNAPLPSKIARDNPYDNHLHQPRTKTWWALDRVLRFFINLQINPSPNDTISAFLATGPPYPLDLCWHLENILTPYPQLLGESETMRSFTNFPRFGTRLRQIKFYMDNQKPSGWYQMWKDKRDRAQHVTFWAVLIFGSVSIVLALFSVAISSAQTVAAFRSIRGGG